MNFSGLKRIVSFLCLGESNTAITMPFYKLINSNNFLLFSRTLSDHTINSTKLPSKSFAKLIVNVRQVPAGSVTSPGQWKVGISRHFSTGTLQRYFWFLILALVFWLELYESFLLYKQWLLTDVFSLNMKLVLIIAAAALSYCHPQVEREKSPPSGEKGKKNWTKIFSWVKCR